MEGLTGNTGSAESPVTQQLNGLSNDLEVQSAAVSELSARIDCALAPEEAVPSGTVEAEHQPASNIEHRLSELGQRLKDNTRRIRDLLDRLRL